MFPVQSVGKSLTFRGTVFEASQLIKSHKCPDPVCDTQLCQIKQELETARSRLSKLQGQLSGRTGEQGGEGGWSRTGSPSSALIATSPIEEECKRRSRSRSDEEWEGRSRSGEECEGRSRCNSQRQGDTNSLLGHYSDTEEETEIDRFTSENILLFPPPSYAYYS